MTRRNAPWLRRPGRLPPRLLHRLALRHHLLLWLLLPQLVLWAAAATVTYSVAVRYADLAIDRSLHQASQALARQVKPMGSGLLVDFPRAAKDIIETDPDERVYYMVSSPPGQFILGNHKLPLPPSEPAPNGPSYYDGTVSDGENPHLPVRIAAIVLNWGEPDAPQQMLVQVARSRLSRQDLAHSILRDTALPLSLLVLCMSALVWLGIRSGLAPLARLREAVSGRQPNNLEPLQLDSAPEEVRDLAAALNALLAAVNDSLVAQRRFISDAAHQLRTPLAGLKSQTELALLEAHDPALRQRLERVHQSATRSAHLVGQLLTLARAEPESAMAQGRVALDLRQISRELAVEWVPRALEQGIDLGLAEADPDNDGPVMIEGHPLLLREAVSNLIDNAVRYAGSGSEVTIGVHVEAALPVPQAVLRIEDTGGGIDPALMPRVFERFVRGQADTHGCGLGLSIVREIVQRHGGSVTLSALHPEAIGHRGLVAEIRLPLVGGAAVGDPGIH